MNKRIVNYKGARAYYDINKEENVFIATLEKYTGDQTQRPPRSVIFIKENGGHLGTLGRVKGEHGLLNLLGNSSLLDDISSALDK